MQVISITSRAVWDACRKKLQGYLPGILSSQEKVFSQPLLSHAEVADLHLRITSKKIQPPHIHDTAEQRMGDIRSIQRGYGLDYEESRSYQPGDEPRYINWKLAAKTGELYMKVFREERRPGVFVLLDRRRTMIYGTKTRLKVTQAARIAACIAFSAQQHHSPINAVILEADKKEPSLIKEHNDQQSISELIRTACAPCSPLVSPDRSMNPSLHGECGIAHALNTLQEIVIPGSTLYLISDFIDLEEKHQPRLLQLSENNNVYALHISDPSEKALPKSGSQCFQTREDTPEARIDTTNPIINKTYSNAAQGHFTSRKNIFNRLNITYKEISTSCEPIEAELTAL